MNEKRLKAIEFPEHLLYNVINWKIVREFAKVHIMTMGLLPAATFAAEFVYTHCTGKKVRQNNDFAPLYPDLAAKWGAKRMHTVRR